MLCLRARGTWASRCSSFYLVLVYAIRSGRLESGDHGVAVGPGADPLDLRLVSMQSRSFGLGMKRTLTPTNFSMY
jgi:citrate lyase gamma subunit